MSNQFTEHEARLRSGFITRQHNLFIDGKWSENPPPPGYKPCAECGSFSALSGETIEVTASRETFRRPGGRVSIDVRDASDGDARTINVSVNVRGSDATFVARA